MDTSGIILLVAIGGAFGFVVSLLVPVKQWLWVGVGLSCFQVFIVPFGGSSLSLSLVGGVAAWTGIRYLPEMLKRHHWVKFVCAMLVVHAISFAWSPSKRLCIRDILYLLPFFGIMLGCYQLAKTDKASVYRIITFALMTTAIEAVLTMLFRVSPATESNFLLGPLARIFVSSNVLETLNGVSKNNIADPDKAGGFFINANVASAYLGFCAMAAWYIGKATRNQILMLVAALDLAAVFFTGSKAGTMLGVALPSAIFAIGIWQSGHVEARRLVAGCFVGALLLAVAPLVLMSSAVGGFANDSEATLQVRTVVWTFGKQMFEAHPLAGLGFGGWEMKFPAYAMSMGVSPLLPPHNAFLILWSKSGILAALMGFLFAIHLVLWAVRHLYAADFETRYVSAALLAAFAWTTIQAQGENFGLLGESHITPLLAALGGLLAGLIHRASPEKVNLSVAVSK